MTGIVERLRAGFLDPILGVRRTTPIEIEAADEIERLWTQLAEIQRAWSRHGKDTDWYSQVDRAIRAASRESV